jgi:hypothetical protein
LLDGPTIYSFFVPSTPSRAARARFINKQWRQLRQKRRNHRLFHPRAGGRAGVMLRWASR